MNTPHKKNHRGSPWLGALVVIALIAAFIVVVAPTFLRQKKKSDMVQAVGNCKKLFYLMIEFDGDYGEYPGDGTAIIHKDEHGETNIDLRDFKGKYSNDYLGQFIAAGYTKSEEIFYAKVSGSKKPDNDISSPEKILDRKNPRSPSGERGFRDC